MEKPAAPNGLRLAGAVAAILAVGVLCVGIVGLAIASSNIRLWLAVLLGINAGCGGVSLGALGVINAIDITLLVSAAVSFAGFWPGPATPHRMWMGLAIALPLAGIAMLFATGLAGRSGLMGGGLALSFLMLGNRGLRLLAYLGLAANLLLLAGDFATVGARSALVAGLVAVGYLLLITWFGWIAVRLLGSGATAADGLPT